MKVYAIQNELIQSLASITHSYTASSTPSYLYGGVQKISQLCAAQRIGVGGMSDPNRC